MQNDFDKLEDIALHEFYRGRRVFVTGHTGFMGSWLCEWLLQMGAEVFGLALPPESEPSLFTQLGLASRVHHIVGDVRDRDFVTREIANAAPDFLFHLAAQPLVRHSYAHPGDTYGTNVMGTVHVLEALRSLKRPCHAVFITTDKCYENQEWLYGYRECDPLGGHDPYSSSKAAAEIAIASFRRSFFSASSSVVRIASARAGNVIGGGDWASDRIVPDLVRALAAGNVVPVRNPRATRPWQHVLEPVSGYLWLGAKMSDTAALHPQGSLEGAFNFGPHVTSNRSVQELIEEALAHWSGKWEDRSDRSAVHEAHLLHLVIEKAFHLLDWQPVWGFAKTIQTTVDWYRRVHEGAPPAELTRSQLHAYIADARSAGVAWARGSQTATTGDISAPTHS